MPQLRAVIQARLMPAKSYLEQCTAANCPQIPVRLLYEKWAVYVHGVKEAKIDKKALYRTLFAPRKINLL